MVEFLMIVITLVIMFLFAIQVAELNMVRSLLNVAAYSAARKFAITQAINKPNDTARKKALATAKLYVGKIAYGCSPGNKCSIEIDVTDEHPGFGDAFKLGVFMKHKLIANLGFFRSSRTKLKAESVWVGPYEKGVDPCKGFELGNCWVIQTEEQEYRHWWVRIERKFIAGWGDDDPDIDESQRACCSPRVSPFADCNCDDGGDCRDDNCKLWPEERFESDATDVSWDDGDPNGCGQTCYPMERRGYQHGCHEHQVGNCRYRECNYIDASDSSPAASRYRYLLGYWVGTNVPETDPSLIDMESWVAMTAD